MPLTPIGIAGLLIPNLIATGNIGIGVPKLAAGIASGIISWNATLKVLTVDVGSFGVGTGSLPCAIPQPLLFASLLSGLAAAGNVGVMMPLLALGTANGLALAFLQGLVVTLHPSVGVGTGIARFIGPPATPSMIRGFASAGMVGPGPTKMATGIGIGLSIAFGSFVLPIPILGPPSPASSSGSGFGSIV